MVSRRGLPWGLQSAADEQPEPTRCCVKPGKRPHESTQLTMQLWGHESRQRTCRAQGHLALRRRAQPRAGLVNRSERNSRAGARDI